MVGSQPAQRVLGGQDDVAGAQPGPVALAVHLGVDVDAVPAATGGQPLTDLALGLAADVARDGLHVGVSGVDGAAAALEEGVEDGEGVLRADGPAEHVAPEHDGAEGERGHFFTLSSVAESRVGGPPVRTVYQGLSTGGLVTAPFCSSPCWR
jgi:hypothetical protein